MSEQHPILDLCLDQLVAGSSESIELKRSAPDAIGGALEQLAGNPELVDAVLTLVEFAHFVRHQQKSPRAADELLHIVAVASSDALAALGKAGAQIADELASAQAGQHKYGNTLPKTVAKREAPTQGQARSSPLSRFELAGQFDPKKKPRR